jgi:3-hydroxyisobutyrate dehydrogenase-like beta-hydroxyacid dehydrogenase
MSEAWAFVGFGELGSALAAGLRGAGARNLTAYVRPREDADAARALEERLAASHVARGASLADTVREADVVLVVVPGEAALAIAEECAGALAPGALYVDLTAASPADKVAAAGAVAAVQARYVDVAVLGTVALSGATVPMLASGPGAGSWAEHGKALGLDVREVDAPAGHASRVKLLRSVYLKGRDALVLEMLVAARRHGIDDAVIKSIAGPGEEVSFDALADRILRALAVHAGRRADELGRSSDLLLEAGMDPIVTSASAERLRWLAGTGLRDAFGGERPDRGSDVLDALDRRSAG